MDLNGDPPSFLSFAHPHPDDSSTLQASSSYTPSCKSYDATSLLRSASPGVQESTRGKRRGPGRPLTARRLWQQPAMKRRLIRLYLYTDQSTLSTKQISHLISAIARSEEQPPSDGPDIPTSTTAKLQSKIRSTQYELQKLLSEGYRDLRPRNREEARRRVASFRQVRHGRVTKNTAHCGPCHHKKQDRPIRLDRPRTKVHLSWVQETLANMSDSRPTSSVCSEIRSLLSRASIRSSFAPECSRTILSNDGFLPALRRMGTLAESDNLTTIIKLCCQYRRDCLHRKFLMTATKKLPTTMSTLPTELQNQGLSSENFANKHGRDMWSQTPLHLAAQWAHDCDAIYLSLDFLENCISPQLLNAKNIEGDTFMHILARRWCDLEAPLDITLASICSIAKAKGYLFSLKDANGRSFFECFLHRVENLPLSSPQCLEASAGLRSLLELPLPLFYDVTGISVPRVSTCFPLLSYHDMIGYFKQQHEVPVASYPGEVLAQFICEKQHNTLLDSVSTSKTGVLDRLHQLRRSVDLNEYNTEGKTCIMTLIEQLQITGVHEQGLILLDDFLARGADLRLLDREGNTALHYAVRAQLPQVAQRLVSASINVHARNIHDETATQIAVLQYANATQMAVRQDADAAPKGVDETAGQYARAQSILVRLFDSFAKRKREHI
ncbi:ankyrin [Xylariaceae sp. FL1651]|nr:ankyrin [Xylariaceae sp. FL1651]